MLLFGYVHAALADVAERAAREPAPWWVELSVGGALLGVGVILISRANISASQDRAANAKQGWLVATALGICVAGLASVLDAIGLF